MKVNPYHYNYSLTVILKSTNFPTGDEHSTHLDMILNPDKITQYQMGVAEAMKDIRDKRQQLFSLLI